MMDRTNRTFEVTPPPASAWIMLAVLAVLLPLAIIGMVLWTQPEARVSGAVPGLLVLPVVLAGLSLAMRRRHVELRDGVLDVRAAMFRQRTPVTELDLARARIVDLEERTELRPGLKTNGMSLPGFKAGHFRMHGSLGKVFCLLTDRRRVLWLPMRGGGRHLLLSLAHPQALLDALQPPAR